VWGAGFGHNLRTLRHLLAEPIIGHFGRRGRAAADGAETLPFILPYPPNVVGGVRRHAPKRKPEIIALDQETLLLIATHAGAVVVGLIAGIINTLAGNGSAITIPMLMVLGLDANLANATNRVGVVLSTLAGAATFHRGGLLDTRGIVWLIVPTGLGAVAGAIVASEMETTDMKYAIGAVMILILFLVIARPSRWIADHADPSTRHNRVISVVIYFVIGVYGGFIQAGVGILLLASLVLRSGYNLVRANPVKVVIIFTLTLPALVVFATNHLVDWRLGLLMACGQVPGAWIGARFAAHHPKANIWIRRLLILILVVVIVRIFELDMALIELLSA